MQLTALQASKAVQGTALKAGPRAAGGRRQRAALRVAAAGGSSDADIGSILKDALSTPVGSSVKSKAASAAANAAAKAKPPPPIDPVPGTELLRAAPPPTAPPSASQGMDVVLEQLQSKPPGYGDAPAATAKAGAQQLSDGLTAAGDSLASAGKSLTSAADSVASALGGAASGAAGAGKAASEAAAQAAAAAADAAAGLKAGLSGAAAGAVGGTAAAAQQFLQGAASEFNTEVSIIRDNVEAALGGAAAAVSGAVGGVQSAVGGAASGVASQVGGAVGGAAGQVAGLLPPEAQEALSTAGGAISRAAQQVAGTDGTTAAVVAGLGLGLPALAAWRAAYGGYAGVLKPEEALEVLQSQDALLLDVRPEAARVKDGVAELRRGARGKGAAVPPVRLLPSVQRRVRDPSGVALEIQALEAAALAKVSPASTKVIVMDGQGEQAKAVARALRAAGVRRPYALAGGFRAWRAAGLAVKEGASEYDASPLDAVGDAAESVVEQAASKLSGLRSPATAVTAAAALGGVGFVALNLHTALQFIGVLGLELTLAYRALSYSSLQDALDDAASLYNGLTNLVALPAKAVDAFQPSSNGSGPPAAAPPAGAQQRQALPAAGKSEARA